MTLDSLNIRDCFVLRRVENDRFVHVGGTGRGEGWAGLIELRLHENAAARQAYDESRVVEVTSDEEIHVFGPYWSQWAAIVPVSHDVIVVFGDYIGAQSAGNPETLMRNAAAAAQHIQHVSPAKRLADELEILHAIKNLMAAEPATINDALQHIVDCTTESLSCDFGVVWLNKDGLFSVSRGGWQPAETIERIIDMLRVEWTGRVSAPLCVQNAGDRPLPAALSPESGVRSYLLLPVGTEAFILVVHTNADSRGFTDLCWELGTRLAESSALVLRTAIQREHLAAELDRVSSEARRDPLTGLANRLAWDEYIDTMTAGDARQETGLVYVDLDNLKHVNDELGHEAGDRIIQAMAEILRRNVRPNDFVVRLGGDEFAILLPEADSNVCLNVIERVADAALSCREVDDQPIRFTHGIAVCEPGGSIHNSLREADEALIRGKRSRHS